MFSVSVLKERLAMAMAVGLRSRFLAHQRRPRRRARRAARQTLTSPIATASLRRVSPAEIPDLARLLLADDAGEIGGAKARIDRADLRPDLAEHRLVGGDGEVADRRRARCRRRWRKPCTRAMTGLGTSRIRRCSSSIGRPMVPRPSYWPSCARLVAAGAEGLVAGAGEHDHAD